VRAEAEALDRQSTQVKVTALLVQLGASVDVDALAFHEVEPERVELAAWHLCRQARITAWILEGEVHRRPALLPPQLCDLPLDPDRRQLLQVGRDAEVERAHRVDLASLDLRRLDLHRADASRVDRLEENLCSCLVRAACEHELDGAMKVGLGVRELLGE
jgi:hypothetical protein